MIKQRVGCVPIHMETDAPIDNYEIIVNVKNNTNETMYITTKDFKIKDKSFRQIWNLNKKEYFSK